MTLKEMMREVFDLLGVQEPPWPLQLRVRKSLIQAHMRVAAEEKLTHASATLSFVEDDPMVTLPADFLEVRSIRRDDVVLREVSDHELASLRASEDSSVVAYDGPMVYSMSEPGRIVVFPAPTTTDASAAELMYVAKVTEMSADGDEPTGLPEPWHEVLVYMAVAKVAPLDQRRDAVAMVGELRGALHNHVAERTGDGSGRIRLRGYPPR